MLDSNRCAGPIDTLAFGQRDELEDRFTAEPVTIMEAAPVEDFSTGRARIAPPSSIERMTFTVRMVVLSWKASSGSRRIDNQSRISQSVCFPKWSRLPGGASCPFSKNDLAEDVSLDEVRSWVRPSNLSIVPGSGERNWRSRAERSGK